MIVWIVVSSTGRVATDLERGLPRGGVVCILVCGLYFSRGH
jgi:hypothetical protein